MGLETRRRYALSMGAGTGHGIHTVPWLSSCAGDCSGVVRIVLFLEGSLSQRPPSLILVLV